MLLKNIKLKIFSFFDKCDWFSDKKWSQEQMDGCYQDMKSIIE